MRGGRLVIAAAGAATLIWLMRTPEPPTGPPPGDNEPLPRPLGTAFDPVPCGTLAGQILWAGPEPPVESVPTRDATDPAVGREGVANPNAPRVHNGKIGDAVVWLRRVELPRSRPWDLDPVSVRVAHPNFEIVQGDRSGQLGIVRRGSEVEFVSREAKLHSARGRGAAFFTQMLPEPNQPVRRRLTDPGMVELTSGTGYYWMRAYLLVSEHPYAAITGPDGRFRFDQVPDGQYEVVCWKANWHVERYERDPELVVPVRLHYHPAVERMEPVQVTAGGTVNVTFSLATGDFAPTK